MEQCNEEGTTNTTLPIASKCKVINCLCETTIIIREWHANRFSQRSSSSVGYSYNYKSLLFIPSVTYFPASPARHPSHSRFRLPHWTGPISTLPRPASICNASTRHPETDGRRSISTKAWTRVGLPSSCVSRNPERNSVDTARRCVLFSFFLFCFVFRNTYMATQ